MDLVSSSLPHPASPPAGAGSATPSPATGCRAAWVRFGVGVTVLTVGFAQPLTDLLRFALSSSLFSHILLIPFISFYLLCQKENPCPTVPSRPSLWAVLPVLTGGVLLCAYWLVWRSEASLPRTDYLAVMTAAYLALLVGLAWVCLGTTTVRGWAFPLAFLVFMIPWPTAMIEGVETWLQHASAETAAALLSLTGTPHLRTGRVFELPGITLEVAQECSGIRSTLVLLITSVLAGHVLLRTRWKRWLLPLVVIPLGVVRNGFRILTISLLCVHVSPEMIDSPIHHRGGPLFFALSLVPLFVLLLWLRRTERV